MCMSHYRLFISLVIDCGDPGTLSNGNRTGSVFTFGRTVRYRCNQGYKLSGSSNRTCEASGRWSGNKTDCKGRTVQFISDLAFVNCFPTQWNSLLLISGLVLHLILKPILKTNLFSTGFDAKFSFM